MKTPFSFVEQRIFKAHIYLQVTDSLILLNVVIDENSQNFSLFKSRTIVLLNDFDESRRAES